MGCSWFCPYLFSLVEKFFHVMVCVLWESCHVSKDKLPEPFIACFFLASLLIVRIGWQLIFFDVFSLCCCFGNGAQRISRNPGALSTGKISGNRCAHSRNNQVNANNFFGGPWIPACAGMTTDIPEIPVSFPRRRESMLTGVKTRKNCT